MSDPIRTLIIDDEPAARDAIRSLLQDDPEFVVTGEPSDGLSALSMIRDQQPDLVFLDVQMPAMDGLTMLRRLDFTQLPVVVFVTAYDRYALQAFDAHALDYLLKPFDDDRFRRALERARERVHLTRLGRAGDQLRAMLDNADRIPRTTPNERLLVKAEGRSTVLALADIDWIDAEGDYVVIHAGKTVHRIRETMTRMESRLPASRFVRIHRSVIVQIDRIRELQPFFRGDQVVLLRDGTTLRLSRSYRSHLEQMLGSNS
ncbi:MAG TPA: response regulator [Gemmatimonadales bacterium]|jgi:two-component system LytT family response regulator